MEEAKSTEVRLAGEQRSAQAASSAAEEMKNWMPVSKGLTAPEAPNLLTGDIVQEKVILRPIEVGLAATRSVAGPFSCCPD